MPSSSQKDTGTSRGQFRAAKPDQLQVQGDLAKLRKRLNGGQSPGFDAISQDLSSSRIKSQAGYMEWYKVFLSKIKR